MIKISKNDNLVMKICEKYKIQSLVDAENIEGRTVLLRVDFNVPFDEKGAIVDDFRIRSAIKTINFLLKRGAKVILVSHLGDPNGIDERLSFSSIIRQLEDILGCNIQLTTSNDLNKIGNEVMRFKIEKNNQELFMLDNIRFFSGEKSNDIAFAMEFITQLKVDMYVNDAFSVSHREQASLVAIPSLIKESFAGFAMMNELEMLESTLGDSFNSNKKITAIIGGKKVKSKLVLLKTLASKVDKLVIVGGMANTFLKSRNIDIGNSFYEPEMVEIASEINNVMLPVDFIDENCQATETLKNRSAYDIGPKSLELIDTIISQSDLVIWNGPAGIYEDERFAIGSNEIAQSIIKHNVEAIVGGGDTVAVINKLDTIHNIYISSGGGAFIAWLEDQNLPGIRSITDPTN